MKKLKKHLLDAALGLIVTAVLFALLECLLWALGAGEVETNLSRGFDPAGVYLEPDPAVAGGWRTKGFGKGEAKQRVIAPRDDRRRVILFGGSNTGGFPHGVLQTSLNQATPADVRFEVINLGRAGYGSGRVALIFEEALARLDPDVVVIYTGHNEFVERGFQMDLDEEWSGWMKSAAELASTTRTVRWMTEVFSATREVKTAQADAWEWEYSKFKGISYEETQQVFAAYADNLRRMCRLALDRGVHVVLSTTVHNRFAPPFESTLPADLDADAVQELTHLRRTALAELPDFFGPLLPQNEQHRVHGWDWKEHPNEPRDLPEGAERVGRRPCSGPFADQDPLHPEPWRWNDLVWALYEALAELHAWRDDGEGTPEERAAVERAEQRLTAALAICPDHPRVLFELALVEYALGRDEATVVRHFEEAARYDRAPRKSSGATNDLVAAVAAELPDVLLFDADALFSSRMPLGLVGWEWMYDHCHLNAGAGRVLMRDFAQAIAARWYGGRGE